LKISVSASFAFIKIDFSELKIKLTSVVKSLYFFSVLILIISINGFSHPIKDHLSHTVITISSVSKKISVLLNCLFFKGNNTVPLSSNQSLK